MTRDRTIQTTLGELISLFYEEFLALYRDEELAAVAAAAVINDLLASRGEERGEGDAAPVLVDAA